MRDGKAFASLSSGLLARKGQARPAMRPQGFAPNFNPQEDLGWNDMGHDVPRATDAILPAEFSGQATVTANVVELPQVIRQQEEIAREFSAPVASVMPTPASTEGMPVEAAAEFIVAEATKPKRNRRSASRKVASILPRTASHKAAFTLRLDADRHLLLRLACAVQHRSAQQIVVEALDRLLAELPDVARLAASLAKQD